MHPLRARTVLTLATSVVIAACCGGDALRPGVWSNPETPVLVVQVPSGEAAPWPVLLARDPTSGVVLGIAKGDASGRIVPDLAAGTYDLVLSSPSGYNTFPKSSLAPGTQILRLSSRCDITSGVADGEIAPGEAVWFRRASDGSYFGAIVLSSRAFSACLPSGSYALEADDDKETPPYVFDTPASVRFAAFRPATIDAALSQVPSGLATHASLVPVLSPDALLIGIGEANHGSREFLLTRLAASIELAQSHRVRVIALEAGAAEVFPLDDYIHSTISEVRSHVSKLGYWMWDTEDMIECLDRLREYNLHAPADRRISLVGIDVQRSSSAARYALDGNLHTTEAERLALEAAADDSRVGRLPPSEATALANELTALAERARHGELRSALAVSQVVFRLRMTTAADRASALPREAGMAEMATILMEHIGDARAVLWAHNVHVNLDRHSEYGPMGSRLRERLGNAYMAVGLFMGRGAFRAWDAEGKLGVVTQEVVAPPASLEAVLGRRAGSTQTYFISLHDLPESLANWLRVPRRTLEVGAAMPRSGRWPLRNHSVSFDAIGFVPVSSPTTPTSTGIRRAKGERK